MNAKTEGVVAVVVANVAVVSKIEGANASAKTADTLAREAATLADASDYLDMVDLGKRLDAILALYMSVLTHKAVKESFSAALAILVADKPVRIEASAKTEAANGKLTFKAPEVLAPVAEKNEVATADKSITTLEPGDAVMRLAADTMKAAATAARNTIGRGRAQGGGRKTTKATERAPFADELVAHLADKALGFAVVTIIETAAKNDADLKERIFTMAINLGAKLTIKK
jgi:hypothetical protein